MTALHTSQSLWDFALMFYAQPQVADACVQLQDSYHANVCLLIGLKWLDARKHYLDDIEISALKAHIQAWTQDVVEPLRSLRRALKLPVENVVQDETQIQLRTLIKQAELLAEKKVLIEIERWTLALTPMDSIGPRNNLERYLTQLNAPCHFIECLQRKNIEEGNETR